MTENLQLMLMIDGDNAQAELLPQMLAEVTKYGVMKIRRVYGDWASPNLASWKELLHTYALKPEQQFSYTSGKNATDIALIIDAMDFINSAGVDGICIVSSDSDYTPLATRFREKNLFVMGIGRKKTPRAFVNACDVFVYTENLRSNAQNVSSRASLPASKPEDEPVPVNDISHSEELFRHAFDAVVQDDGWAHLGAFGSALRKQDPGFDPRTYGCKQLLHLVQADIKRFEVKKRPHKSGKPDFYIRLKV
jgi:uncharacterized LabA/DUF88 family protein